LSATVTRAGRLHGCLSSVYLGPCSKKSDAGPGMVLLDPANRNAGKISPVQ